MGPGSVVRRCVAGIFLALPFFLATLLVAEGWLRLTTNLPYVSRTLCFTQNKREAPGFRPGCRETLRTPHGAVAFRTNEDGFRERPRAFFAGGAIVAMGDSYVEGFWLDEESGFTRSLENALHGRYPLLNSGIRGSGPSQQAIRYYRAAEAVPVKGVLWFLNPSDPADEKYFLARNPGFRLGGGRWSELAPIWEPTPAYWWWTKLSLAFHDQVYLLIYVAEKWIKQDWQARQIHDVDFREDLHCRSLRTLAGELMAKKIPLVFVATPHGYIGTRRPYLGQKIDENEFDRLLACAHDSGAPVIDLRHDLEATRRWYFGNDWHFNQEGVAAFARFAAPRIRDAWPRELR